MAKNRFEEAAPEQEEEHKKIAEEKEHNDKVSALVKKIKKENYVYQYGTYGDNAVAVHEENRETTVKQQDVSKADKIKNTPAEPQIIMEALEILHREENGVFLNKLESLYVRVLEEIVLKRATECDLEYERINEMLESERTRLRAAGIHIEFEKIADKVLKAWEIAYAEQPVE